MLPYSFHGRRRSLRRLLLPNCRGRLASAPVFKEGRGMIRGWPRLFPYIVLIGAMLAVMVVW